jgi:hypothetical protein
VSASDSVAGCASRAYAGVPRIEARVSFIVRRKRWGAHGISPAPEQDLVFSELLGSLALVEPLQGAVVALVETPRVLDREIHQVHLVEDDPERPDCPAEHGRVAEIE